MTNLALPSNPVTLSEALSELIEQTSQRVRDHVRSPATLEMQASHRRWWEKILGAGTPADQVDELVLDELATRARPRPPHAARAAGPCTLRKRLSTLRSALALQVRRRRLARLPLFPHVLVAPAAVPSILSSYADAARLFESLPLHRAEWYWLALWTGQRPADVETMAWADVDLGTSTMWIRSSKTRKPPIRVRIPRPLLDVLRRMYRRDLPAAAAHLVRPWSSRKTTLPLHCEKCGLPRMNATALRHTNLSWIVRTTGITPAACRWAGHSSPRQMERTYAHHLPMQLEGVTDALDSMAAANDNAGGDNTEQK
jgi:integrase